MRYELNVKPEAEDDAAKSAGWYNEQKTGLGDEFLNSVDAGMERIQENPFGFAIRYRQTRIAFTSRFPFGIHFKVEKNRIHVLAILHTSRNPKIWEERSNEEK